jgi:hypothetical protein
MRKTLLVLLTGLILAPMLSGCFCPYYMDDWHGRSNRDYRGYYQDRGYDRQGGGYRDYGDRR